MFLNSVYIIIFKIQEELYRLKIQRYCNQGCRNQAKHSSQ